LVEIAGVDEWLADQGLVEPWASGGPVVVELQDRLYGWDADLAAAKRWTRRGERRLRRTGRLGVDAASVDALARLQGAAVTGRFDAAPAAEVFAAIEAAAGVALRVDWAGMELAPETPVTI